MAPLAFSSPLSVRLPLPQPSSRASPTTLPTPAAATPFFGAACTPRHRSSFPSPARAPPPCPSPPRRARHPPAMSLQNVVIAGGTGFIGSRLTSALLAQGASVTVLTRSAAAGASLPPGATPRVWAPDKLAAVGDDWLGWEQALAGADLVVNLAGTPVVARWDPAGRAAIVQSRVASTRALVAAVAALPPERRPRCLVSASAVGYYGVSATAEFDEDCAPPDCDFLADVCKQWESAAAEGLRAVPETRLVVVRIGVVMGVGGGALARMLPAFQFFVGGPVGSGQQWVSWVHIDDLVRVFIRAGEDESMRGVYNGTAPVPVTMARLSEALAGALKRPNLFPVPEFVLKVAFGEAASVVLDGQRVLPKRLMDHGFQYEYPDVESAMKAVAAEVA